VFGTVVAMVVILKLMQEKLKNLEAAELNREFKDTVVPSGSEYPF
jgi:hypothetical protein